MDGMKGAELCPIAGVPGLYISDRFGARSRALLESHNIKYVLSATCEHDLPAWDEATRAMISIKHLDIDDHPLQDIIHYLKEACDWVHAALQEGSTQADLQRPVGVLVHCIQGISRSGAIIVAYLMRYRALSYFDALAMARESRPIIKPNQGFALQLRIWQLCNYDIYVAESVDSGPPAFRPEYGFWRSQCIMAHQGSEAGTREVIRKRNRHIEAELLKWEELEQKVLR
ncbi:predicted protein [Uncinocarpus reesii 1704]|uniref:protein-tyrosine-phosphatase n=1 Tax=Uncinocarpus reesii (strain UAMH 1704) TaxID=336963 RepID=C4JEZ2_UNCRE|nr:uncharacterized protein UREG_00893 [Uncinocarpus reesii 1704]EEP76045.1 predicted protein [Uncinocarpus reesii 1704]